MKSVNFPIDFVITWVDQSDLVWKKKYNHYKYGEHDEDSTSRFRDYGTLMYLFRSIEKFAPWVHRVFFVTDDQAPAWLNKQATSLACVNHSDYIPSEYLPTFDSNTIELNFGNIDELSEHFVCFNDDMFINRPVSPEDFFDGNGNPRDVLGFNAIMPMSIFDHIHVNNLMIINHQFSKKRVIAKEFFKLFNLKNGPWNLFNLLIMVWPRFTRFYDPHTPISFLKSTYVDTVSQHPEILSETAADRFRSERDYSQWVIRYIQMLTGAFTPRRYDFGVQYNIKDWEGAVKDIESGRHYLLNVNDSSSMSESEFDEATSALSRAFEQKFNQKSRFEL